MSVVPTKTEVILSTEEDAIPDLYGPLMIVLTMAAILLAEMKQAQTKVAQDGTLIGAALGLCITYWVISSLFFYLLGYMFDSSMSIPQTLSMSGYALFGFTCFIALQQVIALNAMLENFIWFVVVGLSCASLGMAFYKRASVPSQGMTAAGIVMGTQFLFLSYVTLRMMAPHSD